MIFRPHVRLNTFTVPGAPSEDMLSRLRRNKKREEKTEKEKNKREKRQEGQQNALSTTDCERAVSSQLVDSQGFRRFRAGSMVYFGIKSETSVVSEHTDSLEYDDTLRS